MRFIYNYLLVLFLLMIPFTQGNAETNKDTKKNGDINVYQSSRNYVPNKLSKQSSDDVGDAIYARYSVHDGNLVETGFFNQGQFAKGYSDATGGYNMNWPKGANERSYGYVFNFFVAGQVLNINGDVIHIVSDRFERDPNGSSDGTHQYWFTPIPKYYNHNSPDATDIPMYGISEDMGVDGLPNTHDDGEGDGMLQSSEDFNGNEILDLSMQNVVEYCAMSHRRETWPTYWPAHHPEDDRNGDVVGYRAGVWNGEFGEYIRADQESFYVMDDHENDKFKYYPFNFSGTNIPDTTAWPNCRMGLGVTVEVRNYQWAARLAEDILISIYDIYNYGKTVDYSVIGMVCDVDVAHAHGNDTGDWDTEEDITYVWDKNELWRVEHKAPTGYFGFAFLESPGKEDGIDNDEDGMIDETQYDGKDNDGDWQSFDDENGNGVYDTEDLNYNGILDSGEDENMNGFLDFESPGDDLGTDGIGPGMQDYTGPDDDGTECNGKPDPNEPNFDNTDNDESDQIGLTSFYLRSVNSRMIDDDGFWRVELVPGQEVREPNWDNDISFTYGSGYVPLYNVQEYAESHGGDPFHRYAIACLFGNDFDDILRNKRTMQIIYDNDYNFAKPPRKPWLKAIAGDGEVVLQWDTLAEESLDPLYGKDFEGYKIYRSTDPTFTEVKTITDAYGNPVNYEPIAQFDLIDGLTGAHPITTGREGGADSDYGLAMTMGTDTGLRHSFVDTNLTNGRTYYYAVTSYDKGYDVDFYSRELVEKENLQPISPTECSMTIQTDALGRVIFTDQNCAVTIPQEMSAGYIQPHVKDTIEHVDGDATGSISINIISPAEVLNNHTYRIGFKDDGYFQDLIGDGDSLYTGYTNGCYLVDITDDDTLLNMGYIPMADDDKDLYFNTNEETSLDDKIYDGFQLIITNDAKTTNALKQEYLWLAADTVGWVQSNTNLDCYLDVYLARAVPRDYEVRISKVGADTSMTKKIPTNFQIWDVTDVGDEFKLPFKYSEARAKPEEYAGCFYPGDKITIYIKPVLQSDNTYKNTQKSWRFNVNSPADEEIVLPENGDVLKVTTKKPFNRNDVYEFTMRGNIVESQTLKDDLSDIYVVPNPYLAQSTLETKLIETELGRGNRRIDFVNLPAKCTIKIFTVAGRLVREINHDESILQGRESWDLRSKDGLEVAAGYYFYYVEAPGIGGVKGKLAIIK